MTPLETAELIRFGIQLAASGVWEEAFAVEDAGSEAVAKWIAAAGPDVAIESLFRDTSGNRRGFIGFRRPIAPEPDRCRFWMDVIARTKPLASRGPRAHLDLWLGILGRPSLLASAPDQAELGVWNQWNSAGPVPLHSERLAEGDLQHGPDWIRHGATAPIVRERQWRTPDDFWIGDVVSELRGDRFFLAPSLLPG